MPVHAKILTAVLVLNLVLGLSEFALGGVESGSWLGVGIRALLLLGFLKGNEGVRTLLLIGAGINVIFGGFGVVAGLAVAGSSDVAMVLLASSGFMIAVGLYMLYALKNAEVQQWMLNRSLGGALDE